MRRIVLPVLVLISGLSLASDLSPYAGEELRSIKSLSSQEIDSLKSGQGMGFAKLAELNHYPGPKHVLELADDLGLTPVQVAETKVLFEEMQTLSAKIIGKLAQEDVEKKIMDQFERFWRLRKLFSLELTRAEYDRVAAARSAYRPSEFYANLEEMSGEALNVTAKASELDRLYKKAV